MDFFFGCPALPSKAHELCVDKASTGRVILLNLNPYRPYFGQSFCINGKGRPEAAHCELFMGHGENSNPHIAVGCANLAGKH